MNVDEVPVHLSLWCWRARAPDSLPPPPPASRLQARLCFPQLRTLLCFQDGTSLVSVNVPFRLDHRATPWGLGTALGCATPGELLGWFAPSVSPMLDTKEVADPCFLMLTRHYQEGVLMTSMVTTPDGQARKVRLRDEHTPVCRAAHYAVELPAGCENVAEKKISGSRVQTCLQDPTKPLASLGLRNLNIFNVYTCGFKAASLEIIMHAKCFEICTLQAAM